MIRMVAALAPLAVSAVYFFGWRVVAVLAVVHAAGLATEWIMARRRGAPISMACFVTCMLYGLSLPPTVPMWIAVVGIVVAILFGKEAFGGFGRNFANPAIVGRAFVYVCFPNELTSSFVPVFRGLPGGFAHWSFRSLSEVPAQLAGSGRSVVDAVSQATPQWVYKRFGEQVVTRGASVWELLFGHIGGTYEVEGTARVLSAGSMGEGCAVLIVLAGVYLLVTRTANWRLMASGLFGVVAANVLFRTILGFNGPEPGNVAPLALTLLAGSTLYVVVFMVTDPVSAPKKSPAQLAYGAIIGFLVVVIRWRGVFVAAASFAVLMGNLIGPLLDIAAGWWQQRRKARAAEPAEGASAS